MAKKKTLSSLLECPTDFLYLWASDEFISLLGNKSRIIAEKKYYQYQSLWKTMADNTKTDDPEKLKETYLQWTNEIASAIKGIYGMSPAEILERLARGEEILGKNWSAGVYGIGNTPSAFSQASNVTVDAATGKILRDGVELPDQTAIYGADGTVAGYSVLAGDVQFQSSVVNGVFSPYSYSKADGVIQDANGNPFNASKGSFWQNTENYMPIVMDLLAWLKSIVSSLFPNRVPLTVDNTVPKQTEWVEEQGNSGGLVAGGLALAALAFIAMDKPKGKKKK